VLRAWMRERVGPRAMLENLRQQWPEMLELVNELPAVVKDAVRHARERRGGIRLEDSLGRSLARILDHAARRREAVTVGAAILLGGLIWLALGREAAWPGWSMLVLGAGWILVSRGR
jgi:ubiquinone biosynthesis protein